jgi:hypothetical protein
MKYIVVLFFCVVFGSACKQKVLSGAELDKKLIETMQTYLDNQNKVGTTYTVKDVNYYTDKSKKEYNCEFHVQMHTSNNFDTSGVMKANIPNDFSKVVRLQ